MSSGYRGVSIGIIGSSPEWDFTQGNPWTDVVSTDAFDVLPYGKARYGNTPFQIATYNRPSQWRTPVGVAIYYVDYSGGGDWQYRIDNGTWTNMGQNLAHDNKIAKFYVPTAVNSTIDFRGFDGGAPIGCLPAGVELFWTDPTAPNAHGLIIHNIAVGQQRLDGTTIATSGDRLAFIDSVKLGTGSPIDNYPNAGTVMMHINDVTAFNDTTRWANDLTILFNRASPFGPVGFMSPWECDATSATNQNNYRNQTKTTAASLGAKVYDIYDAWTSNGWGTGVGTQNAALTSIGYLNDGTHESQAGHLDLATRLYWWFRTQLLSGITEPSLKTYTIESTKLLDGVEVGGSHGSKDAITGFNTSVLSLSGESFEI
ncbi:MAG TPA: hypothetical protein VLE72_01635 [Candidatus Saccharimonadales bacterium]|nr:hypothetical protein [Candidatus Saccharimonadales bacterium]